jgi:hypothetical protein
MIPDLSRFFHLAFSGRAILLCGQDLEPGTGGQLSKMLAASLNRGSETTLVDACANLSDPAPLIAAANAVTVGGSAP